MANLIEKWNELGKVGADENQLPTEASAQAVAEQRMNIEAAEATEVDMDAEATLATAEESLAAYDDTIVEFANEAEMLAWMNGKAALVKAVNEAKVMKEKYVQLKADFAVYENVKTDELNLAVENLRAEHGQTIATQKAQGFKIPEDFVAPE